LSANTRVPEAMFKLITLVCAPFAFILIGLIALIIYFVIKKRGNLNPTKNALLVFTITVVAITAVSVPEAAKKKKDRERYLFMREFREGFLSKCSSQGKAQFKTMQEQNGIDSADVKIDNYCSCVLTNIEMDDKIMDEIMTSPDPANIWQNKELVKMATECASEIFKPKK
jgi:hypothetical protein